MSPQFNENMLIKMYIEVDDLHLAYLAWRNPGMLGKARRPTRSVALSVTEIVTIIAAYHLSGYKCFEYYYKECILDTYLPLFPQAPTYPRFVSYIGRALPLLILWTMFKAAQGMRTGYYFIDSKKQHRMVLRPEATSGH